MKQGYKKTKVGWIPENWEVGKFAEIAQIVMGQSPDGNSYNKDGVGIPLINGPTEFTNRYPLKKQWTTKPTKMSKHGDVLLCVRGSSTGRINIANDEYCIGRGIAAIRSNGNSDTRFLEYQLHSNVSKILELTSGSTFPNIDSKSLSNILTPLPPLPEQRRIARILATWDRAIELTEKLIAAKEQRKKGLMQQLLTGKHRFREFGGEGKYQKTKIGEIPNDWKARRIQDIAQIDKKILSSKTPKNWSFRYISLSDIERGSMINEPREYIFANAPSRARKVVSSGDIIMSTVRPNLQGFYHIKSRCSDLVVSTGFAVISANTDNSAEFIYNYLYARAITSQIYALVVGSNYPAITSKNVGKLRIAVPALPEQQKIAAVLQAADGEIALLRQKLAALKQQKKGLMQQLLTGKVRVYPVE